MLAAFSSNDCQLGRNLPKSYQTYLWKAPVKVNKSKVPADLQHPHQESADLVSMTTPYPLNYLKSPSFFHFLQYSYSTLQDEDQASATLSFNSTNLSLLHSTLLFKPAFVSTTCTQTVSILQRAQSLPQHSSTTPLYLNFVARFLNSSRLESLKLYVMSASSLGQADRSTCSETALVASLYQLEGTATRSSCHSSLSRQTMSPLMMLLAFMLPLLTAATQNLTETDLYSLFPSHHVGDVLNVTQCYCENEPSSAYFGFYVCESLPCVVFKCDH